MTYGAEALDRAVVAEDQIRTVIRTFRDKLFTEIFPDRSWVPKTLIFAKDDSHADDILRIVREEFGKGDDFAAKITYKQTARKADELLAIVPQRRHNPRIAVTVDMIATGTDVKPLECVFFMRAVKSRTFFEQMKGRGVRVIQPDDLRTVTPDAPAKDRFVIVDAVGVTETDLSETVPLDRKPTVSLDKLFKRVSYGNRDPDVLSTIAGRLARLDRRLTKPDRDEVETLAGMSLQEITHGIVAALDPDALPEDASEEDTRRQLFDDAVAPLATQPGAAAAPARHPPLVRAAPRRGLRRRARLRRLLARRDRARPRDGRLVPAVHRAAPRRDRRAPDPLQPPAVAAAHL